MATASDEFFVRLRYCDVSGGMMIRIACGMMTSLRTRLGYGPSTSSFGLALFTAKMPALTISAMKGEV